jgi:iron complex transport system permease protein
MTAEPAIPQTRRRDRAPLAIVLAACAVLLVVTVTLGVGVGSVPLSPATVWRVVAGGLAGHQQNTVAGIIVWQIRLPRVLLAAVVGAGQRRRHSRGWLPRSSSCAGWCSRRCSSR